MKIIPLTRGYSAIVDDDDYERLSQHKWYVEIRGTKTKPAIYAARSIYVEKKKKNIYMHRVILGTPKGVLTDHKNHNGLDNRKENLRCCTRHQNTMNRRMHGNKNGYKGVFKASKHGYRAAIGVNGKTKYIGMYRSARLAAEAYDQIASKEFGEFAKLNFPQSMPD